MKTENFEIGDYIDPITLERVKRSNKTKKLIKLRYKQIYREWKSASPAEVWEGVRDNFIWGFLAAILVVFIATKIDLAVLAGYLSYYFYVGRIINRPKYVTEFGKLIVFPIPSAIGRICWI
jgi:hypothetical protein